MSGPNSTNYPWFLAAIAHHTSNDCLLWPFGKDEKGYGRIHRHGKSVLVHRLAFYMAYGRWPTPFGCHSCDTPLCFNYRHIFEGSQAQNIADAVSKHRMSHGENQHSAKLTEALVRQIRQEYQPGKVSYPFLAKKYGVAQYAIELAVKRRTWKHVI